MQTISNFFVKSVAIFLTVTIAILSSETSAQSSLRIFDVPGGSGNGTTQTDEGNDNSTIYIIGGLVIAGIVAYALFFKEKKSDTDTTAALSSSEVYSQISDIEAPDEEVQKLKDQLPVDIFMGMKNNEAVLNDRVYQVGVRLKF